MGPCWIAVVATLAILAGGIRSAHAFSAALAVTGLDRPGSMTVSEDGRLFLVEAGEILIELSAVDGYRERRVVLRQPGLDGVVVRGKDLWLSAGGRLLRLGRTDGGPPRTLAEGLTPTPDGRRALAFGIDDRLYIGGAPLLRFDPRDGALGVYASGLAAATGFGWHPYTLGFWGVDYGRAGEAPGELNRLVIANHYGWPACRAGDCPRATPAALSLTGHPTAMVFLSGPMIPIDYRGDAILAVEDAAGSRLLRVDFDAYGAPSKVEPFLPDVAFGRIGGLAVEADGSLLVADADGGAIWRLRSP